MEIKVQEILQSELALFHNEGLQVYQIIADSIKKGSSTIVDFSGIERCSTQFLNAAIGKLYLEFKADIVDNKVSFNYGDIDELKNKIKDVRTNALNHEKYNELIAHITE